jgi:hypothetical protein
MRYPQAGRQSAAVVVLLIAGCRPNQEYQYMRAGQPHAEAVAAALGSDWDSEVLFRAADPRVLHGRFRQDVTATIRELAGRLGPSKRQVTVEGATRFGVGSVSGQSATYVIIAECERGVAEIRISMQLQDDTWRVVGFGVIAR